jgi:hypothetical protein
MRIGETPSARAFAVGIFALIAVWFSIAAAVTIVRPIVGW